TTLSRGAMSGEWASAYGDVRIALQSEQGELRALPAKEPAHRQRRQFLPVAGRHVDPVRPPDRLEARGLEHPDYARGVGGPPPGAAARIEGRSWPAGHRQGERQVDRLHEQQLARADVVHPLEGAHRVAQVEE